MSLGRPRSLVIFWSQLSSSLYTRPTSQSCISRSGRGNPLPISTYRASYLTECTHDMGRLDSQQRLHADKLVFTQSYRRFQVNFASASDAEQFINAIRPVCPCKENAGPPISQIPMNRLSSFQAPSAHAPLARHHTSAVQRPVMPPLSAGTTGAIERAPQYLSSQDEQKALHFPPPSSELSLVPSSDAALPTQPNLGFDRSSRPSSVLPEMHSSQFTAHNTSSLPASSQLTPSATTLAPPSQGFDEKRREAFLEALREEPELYNLTRTELENLVSTVVREPGFPNLVSCFFRLALSLSYGVGLLTERPVFHQLEALDSMWVSRGFLGR